MPASETQPGRRGGRLLPVLFWTGIGLAPVAAVLLLVSPDGGLLRVAAALAVLAVVLIGLSIALRPDAETVRLDMADELVDEVELLRADLRHDIATAARATHRAFGEKLQVLYESVEALRAELTQARAAAPGAEAPGAAVNPTGTNPTGTGRTGTGRTDTGRTGTGRASTGRAAAGPGTVYGGGGTRHAAGPAPRRRRAAEPPPMPSPPMPSAAAYAAALPSGGHDAALPSGGHDVALPSGGHDPALPSGKHDANGRSGPHPSGGGRRRRADEDRPATRSARHRAEHHSGDDHGWAGRHGAGRHGYLPPADEPPYNGVRRLEFELSDERWR